MRKMLLTVMLLLTSCAVSPYNVSIRNDLTPEERETFKYAIDIWNSSLKTIAFNVIDDQKSVSVTVYKTGKFIDDWKLAEARITNFGYDGVIAFRNDLAFEEMQTVFLHELGHLLGLPHSLAPDSVMQPWVNASIKEPSKEDVESTKRYWVVPFRSGGAVCGIGVR